MNAQVPHEILNTPSDQSVLLVLENGMPITVETQAVPCWAIVADPKLNPRKFFDPEAFSTLKNSILENKVQSAVWVRVKDGQLLLVAGYRRYKAAVEALGDDYLIPIQVKIANDEEAAKLALMENHERDDVSPYEEAMKAAELLGKHNGDKQATAKFLGWTLKTLENRIALLNLSSEVAQHLVERRINVPTAELLASLSKERQLQSVEAILKKATEGVKITPKEIAAIIRQRSLQFETAIFDKTECAACPHNSNVQSALFSDSVGEGMCTHDVCFSKKQEGEIEARLTAAKDEMPRVERITQEHRHQIIRIAVEGANGIGEEEAKACVSCANYGGGISVMPDSYGKAYKNYCFDKSCYGQKVAKQLQVEAGTTGNETTITQAKAQGVATEGKADGKSDDKKSVKAPATEVALTERVKSYRLAFWRKILTEFITQDKNLTIKSLVGFMAASHSRHISGESVKTKLGIEATDLSKVMAAAMLQSNEDCIHALTAATASIIAEMQEFSVVEMLAFHSIDISKYWEINKEFLTMLTRSEIDFLVKSNKIDVFMGDKYKAAIGKQKADLVDAILNSGFSFAGIVPAVMSYKK